jgi:hypothetical protein
MTRRYSTQIHFLSLAAGLLLVPAAATGTPVFQIVTGTLTVTDSYIGGNSTFDIRGAVLLNVTDFSLPPSALAVFDSTGGTDPTGSVLAFGNATLFATDSNSATSGVEDILSFDFGQATIPGSNLLLVPATITVSPVGSTPDALLSELTNNSPLTVLFNYVSLSDLGDGNAVIQWQLATNYTPEPANFVLVGVACLVIGGIRRLRPRKSLAL